MCKILIKGFIKKEVIELRKILNEGFIDIEIVEFNNNKSSIDFDIEDSNYILLLNGDNLTDENNSILLSKFSNKEKLAVVVLHEHEEFPYDTFNNQGFKNIFPLRKPLNTTDFKTLINSILSIYASRKQNKTVGELNKYPESEKQLQSLYNNVKIGLYRTTPEGKILLINNALLKILDYNSVEDLKEVNLNEVGLYSKDFSRNKFKKIIEEKGEVIDYKQIWYNKLGEQIYIKESAIAIKDDNGKVIYYEGTIEDVTDQTITEINLYKSEEKFRELFEKSGDAILILNNRKFVDCNLAASKLLGYNNKTYFLNTHPSKLSPEFQPDGQTSLLKAEKMMDLAVQKGTHRFEWMHTKKDGTNFPVEVLLTAISNEEGNEVIHTVWRDITVRKNWENELKDSVKNFQLIFQNSPIGIYLAKTDGTIIDVNNALIKILGSPSVEATKQINVLKFPPLVENGYATKFNNCLKSKETIEFEMEYVSKWGKKSALHSFLVPLKNSAGDVDTIYTLIEDITERKIAERNLSESQHIFKAFMDQIPAGIFIKGENGKYIFSNKYNETVHSIKNWQNKTVYDYFTKDIAESFTKDDKRVLKGEKLFYDGEVKAPDGKMVYFKNRQFLIEHKDGKKHIAGISFDVSKEKEAENALKTSEERFNLAMEASRDGLFDWDLITNEVYYSPRWKKIIGYENDELENKLDVWEKLTETEERDKSLKKLEWAIENKVEFYSVEFRMKHKNGNYLNILSRARVVYDENGKAVRVVGTHSDLTNEKQNEVKLKSALTKAEESDRLKSAFLANMSHEIRTPMNGILGFASLLKNPQINSEQLINYIDVIEKSGSRLLNIINDLVDISKIEAGQMEVSLNDCNINEQLNYLFEFFSPEAESKGLKLNLEINEKSDIITKTDKEKLLAILINLIKNAVKYTHEGSISFGFKIIDDFNIKFFVNDTGIGIPADRQKAVFERFIQADIEDTRVYEGAGLGLAISKAYIEMLGGKIELHSTEGKGSSFVFTIPYNPITSNKKKLKTMDLNNTPNLEDFIILVVEDEEISFLYLNIVLEKTRAKIMRAKSGLEAIELVKKNNDIDLILMDIKLPEMNGYEATKEIRKFNKKVKIIAQTAYALSGDEDKALEAGCDSYISKPVKMEKLLDTINDIFG